MGMEWNHPRQRILAAEDSEKKLLCFWAFFKQLSVSLIGRTNMQHKLSA